MSAISLVEAQAHLKLWLDAEAALAASGQSYTIETGGSRRTLTRADSAQIRENISFWEAKVSRLQAGTSAPKVRLVVPRD